MSSDITATLVAMKANLNRSRLSAIEHGYIQPTDEEMERLQKALDHLIQAKAAIQRAATANGWPAARFA
jgi:transcriptional regulator with XRE-family HTH domain